MGCDSDGVPRLNVFALVIYIPDPLGGYLDHLRRELVPSCQPHAHVSVLPPRSLLDQQDWRLARDEARLLTAQWAPFRIKLNGLRVFDQTHVLYLDIGEGAEQLRSMHTALNRGRLNATEQFAYHPHVTLAQNVGEECVRELREQAADSWKRYRGEKFFEAHHATLVQNAGDDRWIDLAELAFEAVPVTGR